MKRIRQIILPLFIFIGFSAFAQENFAVGETKYSLNQEENSSVYEFRIESDVLQDLTEFNWEMLRNINKRFSAKPEVDSLRIKIIYDDPEIIEAADEFLFDFEVEGPTTEIEPMIKASQDAIATLQTKAKAENR